jgi:hypothetical protein
MRVVDADQQLLEEIVDRLNVAARPALVIVFGRQPPAPPAPTATQAPKKPPTTCLVSSKRCVAVTTTSSAKAIPRSALRRRTLSRRVSSTSSSKTSKSMPAHVGTKSAGGRLSVRFRHEEWPLEPLQRDKKEPFAGSLLDQRYMVVLSRP